MNLLVKYRAKMGDQGTSPCGEDSREIMVSHMKRLCSTDWAKDSAALHGPILEASEKVIKAFNQGDYAGFMSVLP